MHHQHIFHFTGIDIVTAANDQLSSTSSNGDISITTTPAKVPRSEPAIRAERLVSSIRPPPIPRKHVWPTHFDFANLARGQELSSTDVHNTRLLTREWTAHRASATFACGGIGQVHDGLSHAIAFKDLLTK